MESLQDRLRCAEKGKEENMKDGEVQVTLYRWAGRKWFWEIRSECEECDLAVHLIRELLNTRRSKNFSIESIDALSEEFTMDEILADQNFPEVEKDFIRRRRHPKFDWVRFGKPSGINVLTEPLGEARVALVSTAGAHCRSDPPFNLKSPIGDPTYREIPKNADLRDILLSHIEKKRARVRPRDHSAF